MHLIIVILVGFLSLFSEMLHVTAQSRTVSGKALKHNHNIWGTMVWTWLIQLRGSNAGNDQANLHMIGILFQSNRAAILVGHSSHIFISQGGYPSAAARDPSRGAQLWDDLTNYDRLAQWLAIVLPASMTVYLPICSIGYDLLAGYERK